MSGSINDLEFEKAGEEDKQAVFDLYRSVMDTPGCVWDENYPGMDTIEFDLKRDALYVMKTQDGRIVGSISIDEDEAVSALDCWNKDLVPAAEIARLAVSSSCMNCGIARTMLARLIDEVKIRGFAAVHYMVAKGNERALRSYAKLHLEQVGEVRIFGRDYYCFEKAL